MESTKLDLPRFSATFYVEEYGGNPHRAVATYHGDTLQDAAFTAGQKFFHHVSNSVPAANFVIFGDDGHEIGRISF